MTLVEFIESKHTSESAKRYIHDIKQYQRHIPHHSLATHQDIMNYIGVLRQAHLAPQTILTTLYSIRKYYDYLMKIGARSDHPCRYIKLRDGKQNDIQLQDLFSSTELERLLEREERFSDNKVRNQIIISLLIYQALSKSEITRLQLSDIDLDQGDINIRPSTYLNERTLKLKPNQILNFHKYITEIRPSIVNVETEMLILTLRGTEEKGEGIHYLIETLRKKYPKRKLTPTTIRQSVITNLLKAGNDLRLVQVFAGHKKPSTTEKYKQTDVEELKIEVLKYHPLS